MYKFVVILLLIGAVASGQSQQENSNIDGYINQNRQQYVQNIRDYDQRMDTLKQTYSASLQVIPKRQEMLIDNIDQTDKRLNNLEILSDVSQQCVKDYSSKMPNVVIIKQQINLCYTTAYSQVDDLVISAFTTRTALDSYYKYQFEGNLQICKTQNGDYNTCAINAVSNANAYTVNNRKIFDSQMQNSQKVANANVDTAFQCTYTNENQVTTALTEINISTDKCIENNCKPCKSQGYTCPNISYVQSSQIDYDNLLMNNLFYGRNDVTKCLLVKVLN